MRNVMEKVSAVSFIDLFRQIKLQIQTQEKVSFESDNPKKCVQFCWPSFPQGASVHIGKVFPFLPFFPSFLSLEDIRRISEINSTIWSNLSQKINFLGIIVVMTSKLTSIISPFWKETNKADLFSSQPIWWFVGEKFCCFLFLFFFLPQSFHKIIAAG